MIMSKQVNNCPRQAAVNVISTKVGTINTYIDNIIKVAPIKLNVEVNVSQTDWQK